VSRSYQKNADIRGSQAIYTNAKKLVVKVAHLAFSGWLFRDQNISEGKRIHEYSERALFSLCTKKGFVIVRGYVSDRRPFARCL
jgi:hypothetical protein